MPDALFDVEWTQDAAFSEDRAYRYSLTRHWGGRGGPRLVVIGLNPSTADEDTDDNTIRRCVKFAQREWMAGLVMLNLFAIRATDPKAMLTHPEPVGPHNDDVLRHTVRPGDVVVAAWGVLGGHRQRDLAVCSLFPVLHCLGTTKDGHPRHPLYLRADARLDPYAR